MGVWHNVIIYLKDAPAASVQEIGCRPALDQKDCRIFPYTSWPFSLAKSSLHARNNDDVLHNVNLHSVINPPDNVLSRRQGDTHENGIQIRRGSVPLSNVMSING